MIKKVGDLAQEDFTGGLNTISDFFQIAKEQSPNVMNVDFNFDGSLSKRGGYKRQNSTALISGGSGFTPDSANTLIGDLIGYWKLNENDQNPRTDIVEKNHFTAVGTTVSSMLGKVGSAACFNNAGSSFLTAAHNANLVIGASDFSVSLWCYMNNTNLTMNGSNTLIAQKGCRAKSDMEWEMFWRGSDNCMVFGVSTSGAYGDYVSVSAGTVYMDTGGWYLFMGGKSADTIWAQEGSGAMGVLTASLPLLTTQTGNLQLALDDTGSTSILHVWEGGIDEMGIWLKYIDSQNKADLRN